MNSKVSKLKNIVLILLLIYSLIKGKSLKIYTTLHNFVILHVYIYKRKYKLNFSFSTHTFFLKTTI